MTFDLRHGDMRVVLQEMEPESIDAVVCDPPYELGFMGKRWDSSGVAFDVATWAACLRVLKPGGHLAAFGGTRTFHRMTCAIEDAGFEIRDCLTWLYGSGFPKSLDVSKAIDKRGGANIAWFGPWLRAERERRGITQKVLAVHFPSKTGGLTGCVANWELGFNLPTAEQFNTICEVLALPFSRIEEAERSVVGQYRGDMGGFAGQRLGVGGGNITAPATDTARAWQGWGTALKPAWEPVILARKALSGTVAATVLEHGTGALNIDGCRVARDGGADGRWPANVTLDEEAAVALDEQSGELVSGVAVGGLHRRSNKAATCYGHYAGQRAGEDATYGDKGGASRFFYTAKASASERQGASGSRNPHPTVKPLSLMRWLCRLITPRGGLVLDPFCGSGTTGQAALLEGFRVVLVEQDAEMVEFARRRIAGPLFAALDSLADEAGA